MTIQINHWYCSIPTLAKKWLFKKIWLVYCAKRITKQKIFLFSTNRCLHNGVLLKTCMTYMMNYYILKTYIGSYEDWNFNLEILDVICCQPLCIIFHFPICEYLLIMLQLIHMMPSHLYKNNVHTEKTSMYIGKRKHLKNFIMVMLFLANKVPGILVLFFHFSVF